MSAPDHEALTGAAKPNARRPFTAPRLTIYGDMVRFTASGTGTMTETMGNMSLFKVRP